MRLALFALVLAAPAAAQTTTLDVASPSGDPTGQFGLSIDDVPDVGSDGADELVAGAPTEDASSTQDGLAYVINGATGAVLHTLTSPNPEVGGVFGWSVAGLADVTGDGRGDVLVGAQGETVTGADDGRAYVFNGLTGALVRTLESPSPSNGFFGGAVAGLADVTGDGRGDPVVAARSEDGSGSTSQAGVVYVFNGANGAVVHTLVSPNEEMNGVFGISVASVPDADGDGVEDIVVGASGETAGGAGAGRAYLFSGASGALLHTFASSAPESGGRFGHDVAGVPDADGDGFGDVAVAADREDVLASDEGRVYLFSGATGTLLATLTSPQAAPGATFAGAVAGVPDADGDGRGDVLIGATGEGRIYLAGIDGVRLGLASPAPALAQFGADVTGLNGSLAGSDVDDRVAALGPLTETASLTGAEGWRLLAAPVLTSGQGLLSGIHTQGVPGAAVSDGGASVYAYDETAAGGRDTGFETVDLREPVPPGGGLAVFVFEDDDPFQAGPQGGFPKTLTAGGFGLSGNDVAFPVSYTDTGAPGDDGWNLVGNPFPGNLDWDAAGWTKTNVDQTIYVYDATDQSYKTWNGTTGALGDGVVGAFQGFWVKAFDAPTLVAPAGAETADPPTVAPSIAPTLALALEGTVGGEAVRDGAFVTFLDGAAPGLDPLDGYELTPYRAAFAALFAEADGVALDVSALPPLGGAVEVPLDVAVVGGAAGELTLTWPDLSSLPDAWTLTLVDEETGAQVDLRETASYAFEAAPTASRRALTGPPVPEPIRVGGGDARRTGTRFTLRVAGGAVALDEGPEGAVAIEAVRPNPSVGGAVAVVRQAAAGPARLTLHDALGREVAVLLDGPVGPGPHAVRFETGALAGGVYVLRWSAGGAVAARTVTVLR